MQDTELYQHILGLVALWKVASVRMDLATQEIAVQVEHPRGTLFACPECEQKLPCYDHAQERRWRHLDSCQFKTILIAKVPRVQCPEHGVKSVSVPWAEPHSRFTILFERLAIDALMAVQNVKGAMELLRLKWDATWHIIEKAVKRGKARKQPSPLPKIGIDEKAFAKGQSYVSMIYDLENSTVEAISDGNDTAAANACFSQLSQEQINSVEAIAMNMSPAYIKAAKESIPLAESKIVHDRFHVMQLATKAGDKVRREEHGSLSKRGDKRLSNSKYLWLRNPENYSTKQNERFKEVYDQTLLTSKAWVLKETLRELWLEPNASSATKYLTQWCRRAMRSKLKPMVTLGRTLKERMKNIVTYQTHQITNAVAEGINSKIMSIKRRVGGYRNRENFKLAIYFYCGGLDLYPR